MAGSYFSFVVRLQANNAVTPTVLAGYGWKYCRIYDNHTVSPIMGHYFQQLVNQHTQNQEIDHEKFLHRS